jgi:hypothetical protein
MSNLFNERETASWIASWRSTPNGLRRIQGAAKEQRANLESAKASAHRGYSPTWCRIPEYERAVRMLERAAKS